VEHTSREDPTSSLALYEVSTISTVPSPGAILSNYLHCSLSFLGVLFGPAAVRGLVFQLLEASSHEFGSGFVSPFAVPSRAYNKLTDSVQGESLSLKLEGPPTFA
jgi:hypothetical protein